MKDLSIKKLYYSISEVSRITGVEQYVLRYWETEFEQLKPQKNRAGNRIYTNKEIQMVLYIKELLREKKYTIEGAKAIIDEDDGKPEFEEREFKVKKEDKKEPPPAETKKVSSSIKKDLEEVKSILEFIYSKL